MLPEHVGRGIDRHGSRPRARYCPDRSRATAGHPRRDPPCTSFHALTSLSMRLLDSSRASMLLSVAKPAPDAGRLESNARHQVFPDAFLGTLPPMAPRRRRRSFGKKAAHHKHVAGHQRDRGTAPEHPFEHPCGHQPRNPGELHVARTCPEDAPSSLVRRRREVRDSNAPYAREAPVALPTRRCTS